MSTTNSSDSIPYKSWITLIEEAERTLDALSQQSSLVAIGNDIKNYGNCAIIFDTSNFRK